MSQASASRTITPAELKKWFGTSHRAVLGDEQCSKLAEYLTKIKWPADPPDGREPSFTINESEDPYWDFQAASEAAKLLVDCVPAMLNHWKGLTWAPSTRGGYPAIVALEQALATALPYIEWPFGRYERRTRRKRPKDWHFSAVIIAKAIIKTLLEVGHDGPSLARKSIVVRAVRKALLRMNYRDVRMVSESGVAAHLSRWDRHYGLTPKSIARLMEKDMTTK
jgi:hypothetical protein